MKQISTWLRQVAACGALLGVMFGASGSAIADTYNIILKSGGAAQSCATGGFTFTKSGVGTSAASGASVTLSGSVPLPCFGVDASRTLTGPLSVTVANVTQDGQQIPSVVSINGNLSSGNGNNHYTIRFLADKTFTVTRNTGQDPQVGAGTYHIYNINSVPEPQTLWLALLGLSGLAWSFRKRKRA